MKFKIRDGFVCKVITVIDLGDGKTEPQENTYYAGQTVDFSPEVAEQHLHKLEPEDTKARAYLDAKVLPVSPAAALGLSPEALSLVQAMAGAMAKEIVSALQAPALAAAAPA